MKAAALVLVVFSTYIVYSVADDTQCCDSPTYISYQTKPGYDCSAIRGSRWADKASEKCVIPICSNGKHSGGGGRSCGTGTCLAFTCICDGECIPTNDVAAVENFKKFNGDVVQSVEVIRKGNYVHPSLDE